MYKDLQKIYMNNKQCHFITKQVKVEKDHDKADTNTCYTRKKAD